MERAIKQTQAAVQKRRDSIRRKLQGCSGAQGALAEQELLRIRISILLAELRTQQGWLRGLQGQVDVAKGEVVNKSECLFSLL